MNTHHGDDGAPFHSIDPPATSDRPEATGRDHREATATTRPRTSGEPHPGRTMALGGLIVATIGGTAAWQLLGPWATAGLATGGLMVVGAVARWRQGARPNLPGLQPPAWSRPSARPTSRPGRATPSALAAPVRVPAARSTGRPRPGRSGRPAATVPVGGRATRQPRPATRQSPARDQTPGKTKKKAARKPISRHDAVWWGRGAVAVLISPVALVLSGATAFVGALKPVGLFDRPETTDEDEPDHDQREPTEEPANKPATPAVPTPKPGPAVARPSARPAPARTSTGSHMSTSPHVHAAAEAIRDHIGGFAAQNAADLTGFVGGLHEVFSALSESLASVNTKFSDDEPVHPRVVDHLEELRSMLAGLVDFAAEAGPIFTAAHEDDLERLDNPRPGEEKMDYSQQ